MAETKGSGSIIQLEKDKPRSRCRKWQLRVCIGKDTRTGKYKARTRRFEGTYTQAKAALREFIDEVEGDRVQGRTSFTFEEYAKRHLKRRELNKEIAPTTLERQLFKAANMHIGKANLASITPTMLDDMGNLKATKTKAGTRVLPLSDKTIEVLKAHKEAQFKRYARTNQWRKPEEGYIEQTDDSPVISDNSGTRVLPTSLSRWWTEDRAKYGLDGWCLHEFRHTYLTLLAINGVHPKVMQ